MQRPLKTIAKRSGDVYIPRGVYVPPLDKDILWEFQPKKLSNMLFHVYFPVHFILFAWRNILISSIELFFFGGGQVKEIF